MLQPQIDENASAVLHQLYPGLQKRLNLKITPEQLETKIISIQRAMRRCIRLRKWYKLIDAYKVSDAAKSSRQRNRVQQEIFETEKTYVNSLRVIVKSFQQECQEKATVYANSFFNFSSPVIEESEVGVLYSNIAVIREFHETFLSSLEAEYKQWPEKPCLYGKVFLRLSPFLKMYTEYTANYNNSTKLLDKLMEREPFKLWLESVEKGTNQFLNSLLIQPIQRIPRYKLLLTELLKYTPEDHIDRKDLELGLEKIRQVAEYVNETQRAYENAAALSEVQTQVKGMFFNLVNPHRKLLKQGFLIRNTPDGARQNRYFYLFNDMLMTCVRTAESISYESREPLKGFTLGDEDLNRMFCLVSPDHGTTSYMCETEEQKKEWLTQVKVALEESSKVAVKDSAIQDANAIIQEAINYKTGFLFMHGGLMKEKPLLFAKWKKRWFVLMNDVLYCYNTPNDTKPVAVFQLEYYIIRDTPNFKNQKYAWEMNLPPNTRNLAAESEEEFIVWKKELDDCYKNFNKPINDIQVIFRDLNEKPPPGYTCIEQTPGGIDADLNRKSGGRQIYLCFSRNAKTPDGEPLDPITHLCVVFNDKGKFKPEPDPPGYHMVKQTYWMKRKADLAAKTGGRQIFLCYKREKYAAPVISIAVINKTEQDRVPRDHVLIEFTHTGAWFANLNAGNRGNEIFLSYKVDPSLAEQKVGPPPSSIAPSPPTIVIPELGWDSRNGFDPERIPTEWQRLCDKAHVTKDEMRHPNKSKLIIETVNQHYFKVRSMFLENTTASHLIMTCFKCRGKLGYPADARMIQCPHCSAVNSTPTGICSASHTELIPPHPAVQHSKSFVSSIPSSPAAPNDIVVCNQCHKKFRFPPGVQQAKCPFCQTTHSMSAPASYLQPITRAPYDDQNRLAPVSPYNNYAGAQTSSVSYSHLIPNNQPPPAYPGYQNPPQSPYVSTAPQSYSSYATPQPAPYSPQFDQPPNYAASHGIQPYTVPSPYPPPQHMQFNQPAHQNAQYANPYNPPHEQPPQNLQYNQPPPQYFAQSTPSATQHASHYSAYPGAAGSSYQAHSVSAPPANARLQPVSGSSSHLQSPATSTSHLPVSPATSTSHLPVSPHPSHPSHTPIQKTTSSINLRVSTGTSVDAQQDQKPNLSLLNPRQFDHLAHLIDCELHPR